MKVRSLALSFLLSFFLYFVLSLLTGTSIGGNYLDVGGVEGRLRGSGAGGVEFGGSFKRDDMPIVEDAGGGKEGKGEGTAYLDSWREAVKERDDIIVKLRHDEAERLVSGPRAFSFFFFGWGARQPMFIIFF